MLAIQISRTGGPEVLEAAEVPVPSPAAGQVLVRHAAVGLNYIDTYHRSGLYPLKLPSGIGLEAAGTVEALAAMVAHRLGSGGLGSVGLGPVAERGV